MKYAYTPLVFGAAVSALTLPRDTCTFGLTASNSTGSLGAVGQLSDGQNRILGGYAAAQYSISNGGITDANNRGCILTPPTSQFQCDSGATATTGFSIGSSGQVTHNGSTQFYACPATSAGEANIYTTPVAGQDLCYQITLTASGCYTSSSSAASSSAASSSALASSAPASSVAASSAPATLTTTTTQTSGNTGSQSSSIITVTSSLTFTSSQAATVPASSAAASSAASSFTTVTSSGTSTSSQAATVPASSAASSAAVSSQASSSAVATTATASSQSASGASSSAASSTATSCPQTLTGDYQYPHLIIPVDSSSPTTAPGSSYNGTVTSTISSVYNFDIPASYTGTCSLVFLFPTQKDLETSSFTFSGSGAIEFSELSSAASKSTDYSNVPSVKTDYGVTTVAPGNSYSIATFACPSGQSATFELKASGDTNLNYFQDYNPSPIGLYITSC